MKNLTIFLLLFLLKTTAFSQDFDKLIEEGDVFYNAKNYEEAAKIFTKAIAASPQNSKGYWYRGDSFFHSRNYADAVSDYTKAIEIEPTADNFYSKRGNSFKNLGQVNKACVDFQKAAELGNTSARTDAREINCDWSKAADVPCPQDEKTISKVEIDPFTGAVFVSKGLSYDKFEFKPEKGAGYITGVRIGKDDSFVLKLTEPRGFCADGDENVFVGIGLNLYDDSHKEIAAVADLYAESNEGLPAEFLKSLSATLRFTQLETGKNYLVKVRFFDKRGKGEVFVEMPFTSSLKTDMFNNTSTTVNTLGEGIKSTAVGAEIKKIAFKNTGAKAETDRFEMDKNQSYSISLQGERNIGKNAQYSLRIINNKGEFIHDETATAVLKSGNLDVNIPTEKFLKENYTIWVKLFDTTKNNFGVTIPVSVQ